MENVPGVSSILIAVHLNHQIPLMNLDKLNSESMPGGCNSGHLYLEAGVTVLWGELSPYCKCLGLQPYNLS